MGIFDSFFKKEEDIVTDNVSTEKVIEVEGETNDLLEISNSGEMKQTRLFYLLPDNLEGNNETLDLTITSTNPYKSFPIFDKLLNKKIKITVEIID